MNQERIKKPRVSFVKMSMIGFCFLLIVFIAGLLVKNKVSFSPENVSLKIEIPKDGSKILEGTIYNKNNQPIYFGQEFIVEQLVDDNWIRVGRQEELLVENVLYICRGHSTYIKTYNVGYILYDNIPSGTYRIVQEISSDDEMKETYKIYGQFIIKTESN